jgi:hypothetical protein
LEKDKKPPRIIKRNKEKDRKPQYGIYCFMISIVAGTIIFIFTEIIKDFLFKKRN